MLVPAPFMLRAGRIVLDLDGGHVAFTTAAAGDLTPPDDGSGAAVGAEIGVPYERWAQDVQVHDARVRRVAAEQDLHPLSGEYDGQVTSLRDVACLVRVADCLPIAIVAPEAVGVLHGGWRSLAAGVVAEGVAALRALGAGEIRAAIGPGAGVCCYEAGDEVHAAFESCGPGVRRGRHVDLKAVARARLAEAGVADVHDAGICTICSSPHELFSHRRDHGDTGRQAGIAWRS